MNLDKTIALRNITIFDRKYLSVTSFTFLIFFLVISFTKVNQVSGETQTNSTRTETKSKQKSSLSNEPSSNNRSASINKDRIAEHIRQALSIPPIWAISIENIAPSSFSALVEGQVVYRMNDDIRRQFVLISTDSRYYFLGNVFDATIDMDAQRMSKINLNSSASLGSPKANITIVLFSDLQCPSCGKAHEVLFDQKVLESYGDQVRLIYKNYPISRVHPWALSASIGCLCAYEQKPSAHWEMQNYIYSNQSQINTENIQQILLNLAQEKKLNIPQFKECVEKQKPLSQIQSEMSEAEAVGVTMTPTLMVNGRMVIGMPDAPQIKQIIDSLLIKK